MKAVIRTIVVSFLLGPLAAVPLFAQADASEKADLRLGGVGLGAHPLTAVAQTGPSGIISTVAGDTLIGSDGNGGPATKAQLILPWAVAVDSAGNLFIADEYGQVIRKVTASTGIISTYAGTGTGGYSGDGGLATAAELNEPIALAVDEAGNLYIADSENNAIRKVAAGTGIITTVAGNGSGASGYGGLRCGTTSTGLPATQVSLCYTDGVAVGSNGDLYLISNSVVYKVAASDGVLTAFAGTGDYGYSGDGGLAVNAAIGYPTALAVDQEGNVYIADNDNCAIRKVTASTGVITSLVGAPDSNGYGQCGLSGDGGPATVALIRYPYGLAVDGSGNVFISDSQNYLVRMIAKQNGNIYTVAGSYSTYGSYSYGNFGFRGDGGPAVNGLLSFPVGISVDAAGNLYIANEDYSVVRKVSQAAVLPTVSPVVGPVTGAITKSTSVKITSPVKGATIYYTTDGTLPTINSTKYAGPITVAKSEVVTAFATASGQPNTGATVAPYLYVPAPLIAPASKNITAPISVKTQDSNATGQIWYTTDWAGTNPIDNSTAKLYKGAVTVSQTTAFKAALYSTVTDAGGNQYSAWSAVTTNNYLYAPAPVLSLASGGFTGTATVTITDAEPYAQIYYTTDGSNPVDFGPTVKGYTGPLQITATTNLQVAAWTYSNTGVGSNFVSEWSPVVKATYALESAPGATTLAASGVTSSGAQLNGSVVANNATTQYWFAYGTSATALTSSTAKTGALTGTTTTAVKATLTGLKSKTKYYFQLMGSNAEGTGSGAVLNFTTN